MSFNAAGATEVPLSTFGSLVTQMLATDLPPGVSPDNQDVEYLPGSVKSRAGLRKVFTPAFPVGGPSGLIPTVTYAKTYIDPLGVSRNLYLDSNGALWVEQESSPGVYLKIATTTPGCYAKSITAFGREYIAISDGLHGQEVPLQYDGTNLDRVTQDGPGSPPVIANLALPAVTMASSGNTLERLANIVTARTDTPHGLQVGYRAQISGVPASLLPGVAFITIDNATLPGIAVIQSVADHGLTAGDFITLTGVLAAQVGSIASMARAGGILTIETAAPHGLSVGASVTAFGVATASFNASFFVQQVISPTKFVVLQSDADATSGASGNVFLNWPLPQTIAPTYFQVLETPTTDTFYVEVQYSDGQWNTGIISHAWNGSFFVKEVVDATTFTYAQLGPDESTTVQGTVTPRGQVAPGKKQMQVLFLTRQGYITTPSPPVTLTANGDQYLHVTDIPIGPDNVVARILAFTGAQGQYFFYIPVPALVNGQKVSTATQIDDNTTTSVILDFSDNTLFASIGINTPGNNIPEQIVLDSAIGFGLYASRLLAYGQRNRLQNLLNMGFDGGYLPSTPLVPTGWNYTGTQGAIFPGHFGSGWLIDVTSSSGPLGTLAQSIYRDAYGFPIATQNSKYTLRVWLKPDLIANDLIFTVQITSASTGFLSQAIIPGARMNVAGSWIEVDFAQPMPAGIPADLTLSLFAESSVLDVQLIVDELSIIYTDAPFLNTVLFGSYVDNPEAFAGVSGKFGPSEDTHKLMDFGIVRETLYMLTQEPSGRLHSVNNNGVTEPVGWQVNEVGAECGALSIFSLTKSQADDASAGGGEEWFAWASSSGARIFGGDQPWKISQEIQPDWESINPQANPTVWAINDPVARVIYFGLPVGDVLAPNLIYPMNYRDLDTPSQIAAASPVHEGITGKLATPESARKWTRWNISTNGAALMRRTAGELTLVLFGGNRSALGALAGFGNVYTLDPLKFQDDDYGLIDPYYVTAFFLQDAQEQSLGVGSHQKTIKYTWHSLSSPLGLDACKIRITVLCGKLNNPWPLDCVRSLIPEPKNDLEWSGASAQNYRMALKFESSPADDSTLDNGFVLNKCVVALAATARLPVRGALQS